MERQSKFTAKAAKLSGLLIDSFLVVFLIRQAQRREALRGLRDVPWVASFKQAHRVKSSHKSLELCCGHFPERECGFNMSAYGHAVGLPGRVLGRLWFWSAFHGFARINLKNAACGLRQKKFQKFLSPQGITHADHFMFSHACTLHPFILMHAIYYGTQGTLTRGYPCTVRDRDYC
jgi:hypothetical protein